MFVAVAAIPNAKIADINLEGIKYLSSLKLLWHRQITYRLEEHHGLSEGQPKSKFKPNMRPDLLQG